MRLAVWAVHPEYLLMHLVRLGDRGGGGGGGQKCCVIFIYNFLLSFFNSSI